MKVKFSVPGGEHFSEVNDIWRGELPDLLNLPVGATFAIRRPLDSRCVDGIFLIINIALEIQGSDMCLVYYVQPKSQTKPDVVKALIE